LSERKSRRSHYKLLLRGLEKAQETELGGSGRWATTVVRHPLSRSSSASHQRLAAFRVRLAGGEAIVAGEGASGGVGDDWDDAVWRGAP
jgi:hypothetical protein